MYEDRSSATVIPLGDLLPPYPIEIWCGNDLFSSLDKDTGAFKASFDITRRNMAIELGLEIPKPRLRRRTALGPHEYLLVIQGLSMGRGQVEPGMLLAIPRMNEGWEPAGIKTVDPAYCLPAYWVKPKMKSECEKRGYLVVEVVDVVMTHLGEATRQAAPDLLGRDEVRRLITRVRKSRPGLVDHLFPGKVSIGFLRRVLCNLLREGVSIRPLPPILEAIADKISEIKDADAITEVVRQSLKGVISETFSEEGTLTVILLDPPLEEEIAKHDLKPLPSVFTQRLILKLGEGYRLLAKSHAHPTLLTAPYIRRTMRILLEPFFPYLHVLSYAEIEPTVKLENALTIHPAELEVAAPSPEQNQFAHGQSQTDSP